MDLIITENDYTPIEGELVLDLKDKKIKTVSKILEYSEEQVEYIYDNFFKELDKEIKHSKVKENVIDYLQKEFYIVRDVLEFSKQIHRLNTSNVYRGQRNSEWKLLPSIHRKREKKEVDLKGHEKKLYKNIRKQNLGEFKKQDEFINEIIKMQHYGIPTPLVDWTTNPLIALFFATSPEKDGKIFIVNYNEQTKIEFDTEEFKKYSEFLEKIYKESDAKKLGREFLEKNQVIFIETINENSRIRAQKGLFSFDTLPYLRMFFDFSERIEFIYDPYLKKLEDKIEIIVREGLEKKMKEYDGEKKSTNIFDEILLYLEKLKTVYPVEIEKLINSIEKDKKTKNKILREIEFFISKELTQNLETKSIIILDEDKINIRKELENLYGIDSSTVYPDLEGYIEYVKENF